jgi:hypothetical protein
MGELVAQEGDIISREIDFHQSNFSCTGFVPACIQAHDRFINGISDDCHD